MRVLLKAYSPYLIRTITNNTEAVYTGIGMEVVDEIYTYMGINSTLIDAEDISWGELHDGHFTGLLGFLVRNEADFLPVYYFITHERTQHVDFAGPFARGRSVIYSQKSQENSKLSVFSPFSTQLWIGILVSVLCLTASLWLEKYFKNKFMKTGNNPSLTETFFVIVAMFLLQCPAKTFHPTKHLKHFLLQLWWFASILFSTAYAAKLVSMLSVQSPSSPVDDLHDYVENPKL